MEHESLPGSPPAPPVITISRNGGDIILSWTANPAAIFYQISFSKKPYFQPGDTDVSYAGVSGTTSTWMHTGAASSLDNWCYLVQTAKLVDGSPQFSAPSNRKCEFTFDLVN